MKGFPQAFFDREKSRNCQSDQFIMNSGNNCKTSKFLTNLRILGKKQIYPKPIKGVSVNFIDRSSTATTS